MAYVQNRTGTNRVATLVTVGAIHGAIGAALIYGFAPDLVNIIRPTHTVVFDVPPPTPLPKVEPTKTEEKTSFVKVVDRALDLPEKPQIIIPDTKIAFDDSIKPLPPTDIKPIPSSTPTFTPKNPAPANDASRWATTNDYPGIAIKREQQGVSRFRVVIGTDGRVKSCEITASSGSPELDAATCNLVSRRAKFEPATNENGEKVVGTYSSAIRWRLPD